MITVVIPYFQTTPGILRKALRSVLAQRDAGDLEVLVADDGSPVSAQSEIEGFTDGDKIAVRILTQPNGGPGAARNLALGSLRPDTDYVAFLDSDDEWSPNHLSRSRRALEAGYDCYFANHLQLGQTLGAFERAGKITPSDHPLVEGEATLHAYQGDMLAQIATGNVIGTSTVVFDVRRFPDIRFLTELRTAGEDYIFYMTLASRGARFAFSTEVEAVYGSGVNVYSRSGWGTERYLRRVHDEVRYRKLIAQKFKLSPPQIEFINQRIKELRVEFVADLLHRLRHRSNVPWEIIRAQIQIDPLTLINFLPIALNAGLTRKAKSRTRA